MRQLVGRIIWSLFTWPLVLTIAFLWPWAWLLMRERPNISFKDSLVWAWMGFPKDD